MKHPIHRLALFIATVFVSALPFSADALNGDDKTKNHLSPTINVAKTIHKYHRNTK